MRNIGQLSAAEGHVGAVTGCFSVNVRRPISSVILSPTVVISRGGVATPFHLLKSCRNER